MFNTKKVKFISRERGEHSHGATTPPGRVGGERVRGARRVPTGGAERAEVHGAVETARRLRGERGERGGAAGGRGGAGLGEIAADGVAPGRLLGGGARRRRDHADHPAQPGARRARCIRAYGWVAAGKVTLQGGVGKKKIN